MRKLLWVSLCSLALSTLVLAGLYLPGAYTEPIFWLPFLAAFLSVGSALFIITGGRLGYVSWTQILGPLRALPRFVQIGLGLVFVATILHFVLGQTGTQTELGFKRQFAAVSVWLCTIAAALLYGTLRRRERGEAVAGSKPNRLVEALFIAVGLGLAALTFVLGRDAIHDEEATHERLAAQFAGATWASHLVAANTYHGAFVVYLDTQDATLQTAACVDVKPVAAQLGRVPELYYASGGHGTFAKSC